MSDNNIFSPEIYQVTAFEIVGDYTLKITFNDQTSRTIDFTQILIGPVFGPLKDMELFKQAKLDEDFGTLEWPNGADIDPTVLHDWPDHVEVIIERRKQNVTAA
jgi:hypothetical protein